MVKLTTKYIIRQINSRKQFLVRRKKETDKQYLSRITHLYLQNQFIDQIMKVTDCQSVSVIYMQNNMLRTLDNIGSFPNLTHLYLQRNFLTKIEHLESLQKLKKIYLGFNEILVLEGFADLPNLQEIHIECQDLPAGETLLFEPLTVGNLETMLKVLDVSQNNLSTLSGLRGLRRLEVLIANNNRLSDLKDVINTLKEWPFLKKLSLLGNPVVGQRWYRDSIIFASKSLGKLKKISVCDSSQYYEIIS
ncbi:UNVERIFIED_CONTAM: hypothetical protein PYX00_000332 [Menopon gallinae]|uniref:Leucine-rich repeat and WD repeat-containing protein 1 LRR domain-containing protein n=1 Tax=Menopon gallinae TaxID=328185 RepID=A0AAW2I9W7_9NEOP